MSDEFDYSPLYNDQQPQAQQPAGTPGAADTAAQPAAEAPAGASAYPNVGSSGINTANTARTDYADSARAAAQPGAAQPGAAQPGAAQPGAPAQGGYYSTYGGSGYGYSYASAPQQPPVKKRKKGRAGKVLLRIAAVVALVALSVGGGFGGAVLAARMGLVGSQVVVNRVERDPAAGQEALSQGSADGKALSLQDVSAIVKPSVVVIVTEQMVSSPNIWFGSGYVESGAGSGVIMTEDGYILTCAHVVSGAQNIKVTLNSGEEYTATVIGADNTDDIAVIKIDATGLTPAVMGDSDALAVGETVVAVGNPLGMLGGTVTNGIVSAINREVRVESNQMTLIQTNAAISPGNSGGGLFNANGELIGIVNAKSSAADSSGNPTDAEGLGFAIPVNTAMDIAQDLIDVGHVQRPALGVTVIEILTEQNAMQYGVDAYGVYISQVNPGSGAEAAGLKLGDRILAVADITVNQNSDLTDYLADCEIGDVVTLQIERDGHLLTVDVTLGASGN